MLNVTLTNNKQCTRLSNTGNLLVFTYVFFSYFSYNYLCVLHRERRLFLLLFLRCRLRCARVPCLAASLFTKVSIWSAMCNAISFFCSSVRSSSSSSVRCVRPCIIVVLQWQCRVVPLMCVCVCFGCCCCFLFSSKVAHFYFVADFLSLASLVCCNAKESNTTRRKNNTTTTRTHVKKNTVYKIESLEKWWKRDSETWNEISWCNAYVPHNIGPYCMCLCLSVCGVDRG